MLIQKIKTIEELKGYLSAGATIENFAGTTSKVVVDNKVGIRKLIPTDIYEDYLIIMKTLL